MDSLATLHQLICASPLASSPSLVSELSHRFLLWAVAPGCPYNAEDLKGSVRDLTDVSSPLGATEN
jgi:hypothetical protein